MTHSPACVCAQCRLDFWISQARLLRDQHDGLKILPPNAGREMEQLQQNIEGCLEEMHGYVH